MELILFRTDLLILAGVTLIVGVFALFSLLKAKQIAKRGVLTEALTALILAGTLFTFSGILFSFLVYYLYVVYLYPAGINGGQISWIVWIWLDLIFIIAIVTYGFFWIASRKLREVSESS